MEASGIGAEGEGDGGAVSFLHKESDGRIALVCEEAFGLCEKEVIIERGYADGSVGDGTDEALSFVLGIAGGGAIADDMPFAVGSGIGDEAPSENSLGGGTVHGGVIGLRLFLGSADRGC